MEPKFKTGEWCFCEFTLQQIKETKEDRITSVTDGFFEMSGRDLSDRCFPLTLRIKVISDNVEYHSKAFHALKNNSLNHPDLNRELISRWVDMCSTTDDKELKRLYDSLSEWSNQVQRTVRDLNDISVGNINLFRK